ncbi:hypothetical protein RJT34_26539 [Clitoria ternatea]|uniref:Prolamin-like domain-containing protein n=1 Tax=Clitoria ternatea TaxID=43366 RepID=A0AAN9I972_CLITE
MAMLLVCTLTQAATCLKLDSKQGITHKYFWLGYELPPEPHAGYYGSLQYCIRVVTDKCGQEMLDYIFYARTDLSNECCHQLIKMGKVCNEKLANTLSQIKEFPRWSGHIYDRSVQAYDKCLKKLESN